MVLLQSYGLLYTCWRCICWLQCIQDKAEERIQRLLADQLMNARVLNISLYLYDPLLATRLLATKVSTKSPQGSSARRDHDLKQSRAEIQHHRLAECSW